MGVGFIRWCIFLSHISREKKSSLYRVHRSIPTFENLTKGSNRRRLRHGFSCFDDINYCYIIYADDLLAQCFINNV